MIDMTPAFTAAVTATVGLIVWLIQERRRSSALESRQNNLVERAMLVMLRNQLVAAHRDHVERWEVTTSELQSFREMHDLYLTMGGNGPASHLLSDLERVRLVTD